ncbi:transposase [Leptospira noguchii]|uniref:Transposase n=2 Tax=Leptospira noguchii TaxID=28182 RepID=A0AAE9KA98_9LEPT|nr:transposase [Leptospira noguchii]UOG31803.1 transposase [Leptospira noguchii]UOG57914.1 transposase [Leptospira noguchii]
MEKEQIVKETFEAGNSVSLVARKYNIAASQLFQWRRYSLVTNYWTPFYAAFTSNSINSSISEKICWHERPWELIKKYILII